MACSSPKLPSELEPSPGLRGWRGEHCLPWSRAWWLCGSLWPLTDPVVGEPGARTTSPEVVDPAGHSGDHRSGGGKMRGQEVGQRGASSASSPPLVCGVECLQAWLSRPGCLRNFRVSPFPDALLFPGGQGSSGWSRVSPS